MQKDETYKIKKEVQLRIQNALLYLLMKTVGNTLENIAELQIKIINNKSNDDNGENNADNALVLVDESNNIDDNASTQAQTKRINSLKENIIMR